MDWALVVDRHNNRCRLLEDPFSTAFGPWEGMPSR
jgi:hypothetical protein